MTKAAAKRQHILESANQLLGEKGLMDITIDEVAQQAGLSKGGVTHYFANKDLLLVSLAEMLDQRYIDQVDEASSAGKNQKGSWTRALISVSEAELLGDVAINNALIAGALASKKVNAPVVDSFAVVQEKVTTDGYDPVLGTIIRLAIDGLYYGDLFDAPTLDLELRHEVLGRMKAWTYENNQ